MPDTQLGDVLGLVGATLGDAVVGVYLHGSAAAGGLRPHSDLDVLVVTRRTATAGERRALVDSLLAVSGRGRRRPDDRPVELILVVEGDVRPWRYPPVMDLLYGEWERGAYEAGMVPAAGPAPDLATLLTMVRDSGRALVGAPAARVLDPVPPGDLRRAVVAGVPGLVDDLDSDTRNVVLTLARVWVTLATGEIRSKDAAAGWALARLPEAHRAVLARARAAYLGEEAERWDDLVDRIRPHADRVLEEIARLASEPPTTR